MATNCGKMLIYCVKKKCLATEKLINYQILFNKAEEGATVRTGMKFNSERLGTIPLGTFVQYSSW